MVGLSRFAPLPAPLAHAGMRLCSLAAGVGLAVAAIAANAQPSGTRTVPPPTPVQQPVSKSDDLRIVGKVLELDSEAGRVKLTTEEGVVTLEVPEQAARAFRVGDTVSVSRSSIRLPSASPRQTPSSRRGWSVPVASPQGIVNQGPIVRLWLRCLAIA